MPRIAFWTSAFEPHMEAIASEVATLRRHFRSSVIWGLNPRHRILLSWQRGFCLHPRMHLVFRATTRLLEPIFDLNHVFGSLGDWFYLAGKRRRPTVLTVAAWAAPVERQLLERIDRFVVEHPAGIDQLQRLGIEPERVRLILPPVDLQRFSPAAAPEPFTALFASSPDQQRWLEARGVPAILDAAAARPQMRFRLLWRPWGDSAARVRKWLDERRLENVELAIAFQQDMVSQYRSAHVTLAPFTDASRSKPAPNSIVESLACGRPVLVSDVVGLAELVSEAQAGMVCQVTGAALADSLDRLQADWQRYSSNARHLAERLFAVDRFVTAYEELYSELTNSARRRHTPSNRRVETVGQAFQRFPA